MSHCTRFNVSFVDKRSLFRAMKNLDLKPENKVWANYSSGFAKKVGIGGNIIGKLLTGSAHNLNVFFTESASGLVPCFESPVLLGDKLEQAGQSLLTSLRKEYVRCVVQNYVSLIREQTPAEVFEIEHNGLITFTITFGDIGEKKLRVSIDQNGAIEETVNGVLGRSCLDTVKFIEQKLSSEIQIQRQWTHEYNVELEDKVIQVLRLT